MDCDGLMDHSRFIISIIENLRVLIFATMEQRFIMSIIQNPCANFHGNRSLILAKFQHIHDQRHGKPHTLTFAAMGQNDKIDG